MGKLNLRMKWRNLTLWKKLLLYLFIIIALLIGRGINEHNQLISKQEAEIAELKQKLLQAEQEQEELLRKQERLQDPEHIADLARRNFYLTKPGEILFIVPPEQKISNSTEEGNKNN